MDTLRGVRTYPIASISNAVSRNATPMRCHLCCPIQIANYCAPIESNRLYHCVPRFLKCVSDHRRPCGRLGHCDQPIQLPRKSHRARMLHKSLHLHPDAFFHDIVSALDCRLKKMVFKFSFNYFLFRSKIPLKLTQIVFCHRVS